MTLRRGESLMVTIAIPVGILVFFGKVDALGSSIKGDPIDFLVPGVLALAVMANAMVSLGIATGFERRYGVLKRLGSTPLSRGGLLAGEDRQRPHRRGRAGGGDHRHRRSRSAGSADAGLVAAIVLLLVGTVAFAGIGMLMAGTLRAEANLAAANGLFLVLMFLGGMAYPLAKLPDRDRGRGTPAARRRALRVRAGGAAGGAVPGRRARRARRLGRRRTARRGPLVPLGRGLAGADLGAPRRSSRPSTARRTCGRGSRRRGR